MLIHFKRSGQLLNIGCEVTSHGKILAKGKMGDTLTIPCTEPMQIEVRAGGWMGPKPITVHPGERYNARPRRLSYFLEKVDHIAGI